MKSLRKLHTGKPYVQFGRRTEAGASCAPPPTRQSRLVCADRYRQVGLASVNFQVPVIQAQSPSVTFQVDHSDDCNRENVRYSLRRSFERDRFEVFWHDHLCFR